MTATMDRMAARTRTVCGKPTSLLDLGYNNVGLDDNWQKCGTLNGQRGFHAADGTPLIDTEKFPSMSGMTAHGHKLGLRVGWCECDNQQCNQQLLFSQSFPGLTADYRTQT